MATTPGVICSDLGDGLVTYMFKRLDPVLLVPQHGDGTSLRSYLARDGSLKTAARGSRGVTWLTKIMMAFDYRTLCEEYNTSTTVARIFTEVSYAAT